MNRAHRLACTRGRESGVGLIEVLIAVLVLSIGMLGLASLQMWTLRNNQSSLERGLAVVQTHSIVDAMHADRTAAMNGQFNITLSAGAPTGATFNNVALAAWRAGIIDALGPGATGQIECNGTLCTITIQWNDQRGSAGSATQTLVTQVQL